VLWDNKIQHGDISVDNLMHTPATKQRVLNDFDLARLDQQNRKPSGKDNTGTMPLMTLDLFSDQASEGLAPRHYRHDTESFAW
ncbi:uncharacterized protein EI90DRAFT_2844918, partial [Cantharellus anzutake]|uniref:uncharacterized protein n=1 Tax=Cantharellus anzutake TaxID=1750568 RepID=UPI0019084A59